MRDLRKRPRRQTRRVHLVQLGRLPQRTRALALAQSGCGTFSQCGSWVCAACDIGPVATVDKQREAVERATSYPYRIPSQSFVQVGERSFDLVEFDPNRIG